MFSRTIVAPNLHAVVMKRIFILALATAQAAAVGQTASAKLKGVVFANEIGGAP
jgi:hypothetical protein